MDPGIHRQTVVDRITAEIHEQREENGERDIKVRYKQTALGVV